MRLASNNSPFFLFVQELATENPFKSVFEQTRAMGVEYGKIFGSSASNQSEEELFDTYRGMLIEFNGISEDGYDIRRRLCCGDLSALVESYPFDSEIQQLLLQAYYQGKTLPQISEDVGFAIPFVIASLFVPASTRFSNLKKELSKNYKGTGRRKRQKAYTQAALLLQELLIEYPSIFKEQQVFAITESDKENLRAHSKASFSEQSVNNLCALYKLSEYDYKIRWKLCGSCSGQMFADYIPNNQFGELAKTVCIQHGETISTLAVKLSVPKPNIIAAMFAQTPDSADFYSKLFELYPIESVYPIQNTEKLNMYSDEDIDISLHGLSLRKRCFILEFLIYANQISPYTLKKLQKRCNPSLKEGDITDEESSENRFSPVSKYLCKRWSDSSETISTALSAMALTPINMKKDAWALLEGNPFTSLSKTLSFLRNYHGSGDELSWIMFLMDVSEESISANKYLSSANGVIIETAKAIRDHISILRTAKAELLHETIWDDIVYSNSWGKNHPSAGSDQPSLAPAIALLKWKSPDYETTFRKICGPLGISSSDVDSMIYGKVPLPYSVFKAVAKAFSLDRIETEQFRYYCLFSGQVFSVDTTGFDTLQRYALSSISSMIRTADVTELFELLRYFKLLKE